MMGKDKLGKQKRKTAFRRESRFVVAGARACIEQTAEWLAAQWFTLFNFRSYTQSYTHLNDAVSSVQGR
jgi:hypothetical protein